MNEDIVLVIVSVIFFLLFMVTTIMITALVVAIRRKAELDFSWLFLDRETFLEYDTLSKETLVIVLLLLFGVVWYLLVGDMFRIPMIFLLLALIQIIIFDYVVKKYMKIPKEVK